MLNLNNKLMLALMLSTSFASKELIASNEDDQEVVDQDQDQDQEEDSDNEEGTGRGRIAGGLGALALLALSGTAYWKKDKIKELIHGDELNNLRKLGKKYVASEAGEALAAKDAFDKECQKKTSSSTSNKIALEKFVKSGFNKELVGMKGDQLSLNLKHQEAVADKAEKDAAADAADKAAKDAAATAATAVTVEQKKAYVDALIKHAQVLIEFSVANQKLNFLDRALYPNFYSAKEAARGKAAEAARATKAADAATKAAEEAEEAARNAEDAERKAKELHEVAKAAEKYASAAKREADKSSDAFDAVSNASLTAAAAAEKENDAEKKAALVKEAAAALVKAEAALKAALKAEAEAEAEEEAAKKASEDALKEAEAAFVKSEEAAKKSEEAARKTPATKAARATKAAARATKAADAATKAAEEAEEAARNAEAARKAAKAAIDEAFIESGAAWNALKEAKAAATNAKTTEEIAATKAAEEAAKAEFSAKKNKEDAVIEEASKVLAATEGEELAELRRLSKYYVDNQGGDSGAFEKKYDEILIQADTIALKKLKKLGFEKELIIIKQNGSEYIKEKLSNLKKEFDKADSEEAKASASLKNDRKRGGQTIVFSTSLIDYAEMLMDFSVAYKKLKMAEDFFDSKKEAEEADKEAAIKATKKLEEEAEKLEEAAIKSYLEYRADNAAARGKAEEEARGKAKEAAEKAREAAEKAREAARKAEAADAKTRAAANNTCAFRKFIEAVRVAEDADRKAVGEAEKAVGEAEKARDTAAHKKANEHLHKILYKLYPLS